MRRRRLPRWWCGTGRWCAGSAGCCSASRTTPMTRSRRRSSSWRGRPARSSGQSCWATGCTGRPNARRGSSGSRPPVGTSTRRGRRSWHGHGSGPIRTGSRSRWHSGRRPGSSTRRSTRLPEACRAAVVLCELEGLRHEEVARRLGCTDRTLRRRLVRARTLLRARLTRRGLALTAGLLAAIGPEPASAAVPQTTVDLTTRAAIRFAAGQATAGAVSATASALAEGVIAAMLWTKLKALAIVLGVGSVLAAGVGTAIAVDPRLAAQVGGSHREVSTVPQSPPPSQSGETARAEQPSSAEQYRTLVRHYDEARAAHRKLGEKARTQAEAEAAYKDHPAPEGEFTPRFFALAKRYPNDPIAVDALVWVVERSMTHAGRPDGPMARMTGRAMTILAHDHLGDPRLGPACLKLAYYPSPDRDAFLRAVAERSPDRIARGRATLALAQYLKMKGELIQTLKKAATSGGYDESSILGMYGREYLGQLRAADSAAILRESDHLFALVDAEYGDAPYASPDDQPTTKTLAEVVHPERRVERPVPTIRREGPHQAIENAYNVAILAANRAGDEAKKKAGPPGGSMERILSAWSAAYPKWRRLRSEDVAVGARLPARPIRVRRPDLAGLGRPPLPRRPGGARCRPVPGRRPSHPGPSRRDRHASYRSERRVRPELRRRLPGPPPRPAAARPLRAGPRPPDSGPDGARPGALPQGRGNLRREPGPARRRPAAPARARPLRAERPRAARQGGPPGDRAPGRADPGKGHRRLRRRPVRQRRDDNPRNPRGRRRPGAVRDALRSPPAGKPRRSRARTSTASR